MKRVIETVAAQKILGWILGIVVIGDGSSLMVVASELSSTCLDHQLLFLGVIEK